MKAKISTLVLILGAITFTSCGNDSPVTNDDSPVAFESTAVISGFDKRMCRCCGGWIINIDGEELSKRFDELPQNTFIDLQSTTFPVNVQLNWTESNDYCGQGIVVDSIELVE
jgi:hypothetical protein